MYVKPASADVLIGYADPISKNLFILKLRNLRPERRAKLIRNEMNSRVEDNGLNIQGLVQACSTPSWFLDLAKMQTSRICSMTI